jgi:uncharacterized protein (DUF2267 family)
MSATGLEVFDRTLQTTNIWLKELAETTGPERKRAWHVLGAVLHALRDRLSVGEAAHLAAEMPLLVRGLYYDQWRPSVVPVKVRRREDFVALVAAGLKDMGPIDPEEATRAVFQLLERHVSRGEIDQMKQSMPVDIRTLWP